MRHRYSERARRNIRNQLTLKFDLYIEMASHFTNRLEIYSKMQKQGMTGLGLHLRTLKKRAKKNFDHANKIQERIDELESEGKI